MARRTGKEKKITVEVDEQLRNDIHIYARKHGTTVKALLEEWIRETLEMAGFYSSPGYRHMVEKLLEEGKHTQSEITKMVCEKLPWVKKSDVQQLVSDSKNPNLKRFARKVVEIERKCLGFEKPKKAKAETQDIPAGGEAADPSN
jgi:hypothetical protein